MKRLVSVAILSFVLFPFTAAPAALHYTGGHADIDINYESGSWRFHVHAEEAVIGGVHDVSGHFDPDQIRIIVPDHAMTLLSGGSEWAFAGTSPGSPIWILPQHHNSGGHDHDHDHMPFLGIGAEEMESGLFIGNRITLTLGSVSGPGYFSVWQTDPFGGPIVYVSSFDPASVTALILSAGLHGHYNWGFTAPGFYEIELIASGQLTDQTWTSDSAVYSFLVAPEPASVVLLALGFLTLQGKKRT